MWSRFHATFWIIEQIRLSIQQVCPLRLRRCSINQQVCSGTQKIRLHDKQICCAILQICSLSLQVCTRRETACFNTYVSRLLLARNDGAAAKQICSVILQVCKTIPQVCKTILQVCKTILQVCS